jgi:hypothetical protein
MITTSIFEPVTTCSTLSVSLICCIPGTFLMVWLTNTQVAAFYMDQLEKEPPTKVFSVAFRLQLDISLAYSCRPYLQRQPHILQAA